MGYLKLRSPGHSSAKPSYSPALRDRKVGCAMTKSIVGQNLTFDQGSELVQALVRQGLNSQGAQHLIEDQNLARQVVNLAQGKESGEVTPWNRAAAIMGGRAIGIAVASRLGLNVRSTAYPTVPFSQVELVEAARQGLYLVAMPSVDLLSLSKAAGNLLWNQDWYQGVKFAKAKSRAGYHLLRQLPGSTSKNWSEQGALQPLDFEAPMAVEIAYLAAAWLALNRGMAFPDWVRTSDVDSVGGHVIVGLGGSRVDVRSYWDSGRDSDVAVASGQFRPLAS